MVSKQSIRDQDLSDFTVTERLYEGRTEFQDVIIADTREWGKALLLDGTTQSTERDEYIYHEALVHPAMCCHGHPRSVLIIGGGEGATLREALAHESVERAVMVDIDRELVALCKRHLPEWSRGSFEDPRAEFFAADGKHFVDQCNERFDVVLIDLVDELDGPAAALYTESFYQQVRSLLNPGGVLALQAMQVSGAHQPEHNDHLRIRRRLGKLFPIVRTYLAYVPSFWAEWAFLIASDDKDPSTLSSTDIARFLAHAGPYGHQSVDAYLRYYDADAHSRMFTLTKDLRRLLGEAHPLEDGAA